MYRLLSIIFINTKNSYTRDISSITSIPYHSRAIEGLGMLGGERKTVPILLDGFVTTRFGVCREGTGKNEEAVVDLLALEARKKK